MGTNNVYSSAKVLNSKDQVQDYQLGTFASNNQSNDENPNFSETKLIQPSDVQSNDALMNEIRNLTAQISQINLKITNIENDGIKGKDIDAQVIQAIKDLKHYAAFFEQATFQMETKLLKTSIAIAQKIISVEIGENSSKIAAETINHIMHKIKTASKIQIHLNPKDYEVLKSQLNLEPFIELHQDANVAAGGVVIASDLGNFDGNIESKVASMLESLDNVI